MITPALDSTEYTIEPVNAAPPTVPPRTESARMAPDAAFQLRAVARVSRAGIRRAPAFHRAALNRPASVGGFRRPTAFAAARAARFARWFAAREAVLLDPAAGPGGNLPARLRDAAGPDTVRRAEPITVSRVGTAVRSAARPAFHQRRTVRAVVTRHAVVPSTRRVALPGGLSAVIAYARAQVGKRYVTGGEGAGGFDCSGLTRQAYAQAGIRLPHSSGAQAARARVVSRAQARPGDLVMGPGHVGIYMGHGMMIDAGNHRTGVVYRKLYSGLRVGRL